MAVDIRSLLTRGLIISVILGITVVVFVYFSISIATRSHPVSSGTASPHIAGEVHTYRNQFGIPHIIGANTSDVLFAQGYAHAQDRLWQMDVWRRIGKGTLAEVLGPDGVSVDAFMRAVGIETIARRQWNNLPKETRLHLLAYSQGVTAYINENLQHLSMEFDALQYVPEDWSPIDCLIVGRVISFELSISFWNDITYAQIAAQRGVAAMQQYVPSPQGPPYVLRKGATEAPDQWRSTAPPDSSSASISSALTSTRDALEDVRAKLGIRGSAYGSNCWAVLPDTGAPILANDPHLGVSLPAKWYQIHLTSDEMNVVGLSIPGIPFVLSGRNDHVTWGFTNAMVDDVDYIIERMDQSNNNYYFDGDGNRKKIRFDLDTIRIKGAPDSLIYLRYTNNGCVISDYHLLRHPTRVFGRDATSSTERLSEQALTFRWTASFPSNEIGSLFKTNTATSSDEVVAAFSTWNTPAFNVHVADTAGVLKTIGAGVFPDRKNMDPLLATGSWVKGATWSGLRRLSELGSVTVTQKGSVASANNAHSPSNSPFVSTIYQPSSRIKRINELISVYTQMSARDAQVMQSDAVSPYALSILSRVLPYLEKRKDKLPERAQGILNLLRGWDGGLTTKSRAAAVYTMFLERLMYNTFEDELGKQLYLDWVLYTPNAFTVLDRIVDDPRHRLFDDYTTKERETLSWMVIKSYVEALNTLTETLGPDTGKWTYGALHTVEFPHLVGENPLMKSIMNDGPYEMVGDLTTLNNSEWSMQNPFKANVVSSARLISSLNDSIQHTVLPGGSSGQPLAAHYTDQMQLWLNGGYVRLPVGPEPGESFTLYHVFKPE